jgi:hypothetical protein
VDRLTVGDLSDPSAVQEAIDEFDRLGREAFLEKYSFGPSASYVIVQNGREYPSKAIVGAAHGYQFDAPLRNVEFSGGLGSTVPKLRSLGFEVRNTTEPDTPDRDYVRSLTVLALVELGRPAHRDEVIAAALEIGGFSEAELAIPAPPSHPRYGSLIGYWLSWSLSENKNAELLANPSHGYWALERQ